MFNNTSFLDIPEILTRNMARRYITIGCGVNVGLKSKGLFDVSHCEESSSVGHWHRKGQEISRDVSRNERPDLGRCPTLSSS